MFHYGYKSYRPFRRFMLGKGILEALELSEGEYNKITRFNPDQTKKPFALFEMKFEDPGASFWMALRLPLMTY